MNTACALDVPAEGIVLEGQYQDREGEVWNIRGHSLDLERTRKEGLKQRRRHDGTQELRNHIHKESDWVDGANEEHREGNIGIEEATRDTVKEPHGNEKGESHRHRRVEDRHDRCAARGIGRERERGLDATKAEDEEQDLDQGISGSAWRMGG